MLQAIIISASLSQSSVADPGFQGSLGFGINGDESYQTYVSPYYGYGSRYYGTPVSNPAYSYFGNYQGFGGPHDVYVPGRMNPFSYPYRSTRSPDQGSYIYGLNNANSPRSSIYETSMIPAYSKYITDRYQLVPYLESFETYSIFSPKTSQKSSGSRVFRQNLETVLDSNKTSNASHIESTKRTLTPEGETSNLKLSSDEASAKSERDLQLTYLGHVPDFNLRNNPQEPNNQSSNGMNLNFMPFFPLKLETNNSSGSQSLLPFLSSPYGMENDKLRQLRQSFSKYQQTSFNAIRPSLPIHQSNPTITHNPMMEFSARPPIVSPYLNNYASPSSETHYSATTTQFSSGVSAPDMHSFRSPAHMLGTPLVSAIPSRYSRTPAQRTQNGYYMYDVQPLKAFDQNRIDGYSNLKMAGPGYIQEANKFTKLPQEIYNSGLQSVQPYGRTFSRLFMDRQLPIQQNSHQTQHSLNSGRQMSLNPFGPTGLLS